MRKPRAVETVMLEDLRVAAARGNVGKADRVDVGAHAVSRERRRNHDALAERHIVVVERDDDGKTPQGVAHPSVLDAVQPG